MILVINSGSTSLKYKLFNEEEKEIKSGNFDNVSDLDFALKNILREIGDLRDIKAVGHRVVHGGDKFIEPTLVDDKILSELEKLNDLAPLHNPFNLAGIKSALGFLPDVPQVAVFDTAFFSNLPEVAQTYAIPQEIIEEYKIKKFGFHGTSYAYITSEACKILKKKINKINLIACHLGGGWSISAIKNGEAVDTSMGLTPLEGLIMMTRAGDLDPGIIFKLLKITPGYITEEKVDALYNLLNKESGIKGISGINNFKDLLKNVSAGNKEAKLAFDMAIYRLVKYIGAYFAVLEGKVDAIIFTGGIGAGNSMTKNSVMGKLKFLGKTLVLSIKTNEELMIARYVKKII
ncbi:MAG: acetate/propionate family kinase [Candidatus Falkowbacteria bacterium]